MSQVSMATTSMDYEKDKSVTKKNCGFFYVFRLPKGLVTNLVGV